MSPPKPGEEIVIYPKGLPDATGGSTGTGGSTTGGRSGGGGGGGGGGIKKTNDAPQVAALKKLLDSSFALARDIKLANVQRLLSQQDADLLKGYDERAAQLAGSRADNEKAESAGTFAALANRARERADLLAEAALQGAGESDTLKVQMQALRNWSANQSDVNRAYYDTQRSINAAIADLNADTRSARTNLHGQALSDMEQIWANYYNQRAEAWTQLGNIQSNPYSDSYKKGSTAFDMAAKEAAQSWSNPGVPKAVQNWQGSVQAEERRLNNSAAEAAVTNLAQKKPEGATLRKW